jgi:hypothetical protein
MRATLLLAPILIAGCSATDGRQSSSRDMEALERLLADRVAGPPQDCVPQRPGASLRAADRRTILYDTGREIWVNRLDAECPGLRPDSTLVIEAHDSRYCRLDRVRAIEPGATIPGPVCALRSFTPYRRRT